MEPDHPSPPRQPAGPRTGLFLTGATGFVGRQVVEHWCQTSDSPVRILVRSAHRVPRVWLQHPQIEIVVGELGASELWMEPLARSACVLHAAAAVGRHRPDVYHQVNVQGTESLLQACHAVGVPHFVFVSSIAARFTNLDEYPYAASKRLAESLVELSGLPYTIIRPTIVLGPRSAAAQALTALARLPVIPLFGGARAAVQPVGVNDLAELLVIVAQSQRPLRTTWEIGGDEQLSMRDLLRRMRAAAGGGAYRALSIPTIPLRAILRILESLPLPPLPLTCGQLSPFWQDSTCQARPLQAPIWIPRTPLDTLLTQHLHDHGRDSKSTAMSSASDSPIVAFRPPGTCDDGSSAGTGSPLQSPVKDRECQILAKYLLGVVPTEVVEQAYEDAHRQGVVGDARSLAAGTPLVAWALSPPRRLAWADAYCRFFARDHVLRRKLALVIALTENDHVTSSHYLPTTTRSAWRVMVSIGVSLLADAFRAVLAWPLLRRLSHLSPASIGNSIERKDAPWRA